MPVDAERSVRGNGLVSNTARILQAPSGGGGVLSKQVMGTVSEVEAWPSGRAPRQQTVAPHSDPMLNCFNLWVAMKGLGLGQM